MKNFENTIRDAFMDLEDKDEGIRISDVQRITISQKTFDKNGFDKIDIQNEKNWFDIMPEELNSNNEDDKYLGYYLTITTPEYSLDEHKETRKDIRKFKSLIYRIIIRLNTYYYRGGILNQWTKTNAGNGTYKSSLVVLLIKENDS